MDDVAAAARHPDLVSAAPATGEPFGMRTTEPLIPLQRAITETGCEHVLIRPGGGPSIEMMELFSREVAPALH
jgi:hypothetical protein